jgi:hypothetical protein
MKNDDAIKLLLAKPSFKAVILALRDKWSIPSGGYKTNKEWNTWRESISEAQSLELQADIDEVISVHKLSDRWSLPLRQYLLDNVATRLRAAPYTEWRFEYDGDATDPQNIQAVWIKVDADTTQNEVVDALKQAKSMLPRKPKKQTYTYIDHALKAKELKKPGVKWLVVTQQVNKKYGTNYDENYVIKMVSRLNKHL